MDKSERLFRCLLQHCISVEENAIPETYDELREGFEQLPTGEWYTNMHLRDIEWKICVWHIYNGSLYRSKILTRDEYEQRVTVRDMMLATVDNTRRKFGIRSDTHGHAAHALRAEE